MSAATTEDESAKGVADENDDNFSESVDEVIRLLDELTPSTDDGGDVPPSFGPEVGREEGTLSGEIVETAQPQLQARPPNSYCGESTTVLDCCQHREDVERLQKQLEDEKRKVEDAKTREDQMAASLKDARAENEELKEAVEILKDENSRIKRNNRMLSTSAMRVPVHQDIMVYSVEAPETQPPLYQQTEKKVIASGPDEGGDTPWPGRTGDQQPAPLQLFKPAPQALHATIQPYQPPPQPYQPTPQPYQTAPQLPPQPYQSAPQLPPQPYQSAPQLPPQPYQSAPQLPPQPYQPTPQHPPQPYQPTPQPYQPTPQVYPPTVQGYSPLAPLQYQPAPQVVPPFGTQQPAAAAMQFNYPAMPPAGQPHNHSTFNITFSNAPAQASTAGAHQGHPVAEVQRDPGTTHQFPPEESLRYPIQVDETQKQSDCPVTYKKTTVKIQPD